MTDAEVLREMASHIEFMCVVGDAPATVILVHTCCRRPEGMMCDQHFREHRAVIQKYLDNAAALCHWCGRRFQRPQTPEDVTEAVRL